LGVIDESQTMRFDVARNVPIEERIVVHDGSPTFRPEGAAVRPAQANGLGTRPARVHHVWIDPPWAQRANHSPMARRRSVGRTIGPLGRRTSIVGDVSRGVAPGWVNKGPFLAQRGGVAARARRMDGILNLKQWEDLDDATHGGQILF
jgi:hypothetical protein